jgi:hypothetical protein
MSAYLPAIYKNLNVSDYSPVDFNAHFPTVSDICLQKPDRLTAFGRS